MADADMASAQLVDDELAAADAASDANVALVDSELASTERAADLVAEEQAAARGHISSDPRIGASRLSDETEGDSNTSDEGTWL